MTNWFTALEIAEATGESVRSVNRIATKQGWRRNSELARKRSGRGGGWEYHKKLLLPEWQAVMMVQEKVEQKSQSQEAQDEPNISLWSRYEALTAKQKAVCKQRLDIIVEIDNVIAAGFNETTAIKEVSKTQKKSVATLFNWRSMIRGIEPQDRLAALAPEWKGSCNRKDVHAEAWSVLKSDYLRNGEPRFSSCYRRMVKLAEKNNWYPIPAERVLFRRLNAEVPIAVQVLAREGTDKAKTLIPAQRRSVAHMHAMYAVNMDGHKLDVFVDLGEGRKVTRVMLVALQDLYSRKFVAWRVAESENKDVVRLVIGDMVESFGIPEKIYVDNGHAFAAKSITGGIPNRYRFKVKDEDPKGLLTTLGVDVTFVTPAAGQSKPIERSFKDLAEEIARHPLCDGAYTGNAPDKKPANYGKKAMGLAELRSHVDEQIMEHNARIGRRTEMAKGKSFDHAFKESVNNPATIIRWPTSAQKSLWLMASEQIRAQRGSGVINMMGNRYWAIELNAYAGKNVTVRFDPDYLKAGVRVYDLDDRLICFAECKEDTGFDDLDGARQSARDRNTFMRLNKQLKQLHIDKSPKQLAEIYASDKNPKQTKPMRPSVTRLATSALATQPVENEEEWDAPAEEGFSNFMRLVSSRDLDE